MEFNRAPPIGFSCLNHHFLSSGTVPFASRVLTVSSAYFIAFGVLLLVASCPFLPVSTGNTEAWHVLSSKILVLVPLLVPAVKDVDVVRLLKIHLVLSLTVIFFSMCCYLRFRFSKSWSLRLHIFLLIRKHSVSGHINQFFLECGLA